MLNYFDFHNFEGWVPVPSVVSRIFLAAWVRSAKLLVRVHE